MSLLTDNLATWLLGVFVALLTVFSDRIVGRIRFRLNKSDLRVRYFEELALAVSTYLFFAGLFEERHRRGWANDPDDMNGIGGEVNRAITTLRAKEFIYRAWAKKYWGPGAAADLDALFAKITVVEDAVHAFNDSGQVEEKKRALATALQEARTKAVEWLSDNNA